MYQHQRLPPFSSITVIIHRDRRLEFSNFPIGRSPTRFRKFAISLKFFSQTHRTRRQPASARFPSISFSSSFGLLSCAGFPLGLG